MRGYKTVSQNLKEIVLDVRLNRASIVCTYLLKEELTKFIAD